ncbi:MAG: terpene cyclase/mutase family protein [Undibacterium sp.]|nr:terpene cyclase/mutase family protein [Opitutaceae bacterium]
MLRYLAAHARPDGGYAFSDQARSHLTPTYATIGCHHLLGVTPPAPAALAHFVRTHHPRELKKLEQERRSFEFQQVQALVWLGDAAVDFHARIATFTAPLPYLKQYEQHGYPVFQSELGLVQASALLGLPLAPLRPAFTDYVTARRRANGSYNNTPAADGGDGHVMNTLWGLQAARTLGLPPPGNPAATVAWLHACQLPDGGFTYQPAPAFGGVTDVAYTRAVLRALQLLGAAPADPAATRAWLHRLANADGGFADRPGWLSNPLATYHALDALAALGPAEPRADITRRAAPTRTALPENLKLFSLQLEAHGTGSPAEAVALAGALRIDLWGAKNATPARLARAAALAAEARVPVKFFRADEEYGTWIDVPGLGTYSHMSDVMAPADTAIGPPLGARGETSPPVTWPDFRTRRLEPLRRGQGRLVWQFGENEELVRALLDDSVERGGFAAISTFHFGNPDFTNSEPFLHRWRGQLPFVGLQDAHGAESWWFADQTTGYRTLFLATAPTWAGWLEALAKNRVVAARHDEVSRGETWLHSGSDEVLAFVRAREATWRWWNDGPASRPLVSLVALRPDDEFEVGRPAHGLALRVRCAWKNTPQGLPQSPLAELVRLTLDDAPATAVLVERPRAKGPGLSDHYHLLALPTLAPGEHRATAIVRELATGRETTGTLRFNAP